MSIAKDLRANPAEITIREVTEATAEDTAAEGEAALFSDARFAGSAPRTS